MAVYYRYKSGVETFSVPVVEPSVTVAELKRLIMGTSRHGHGRTRGRGPREGVALSNAQTGEEYADEGELVPCYSTVVVRRVAGPPAETIVASSSPRPPKAAQGGSSSSSSGSAAATRSSASAGAEDDDEAKAISAVIDAAEVKWEGPSQGARWYGRRGAPAHGGGPAPPAWYVCHRCRVAGHFIQHCPTNGDPGFDNGRVPAPTPVPAPAALAPVPSIPEDGAGIPPELHCKICKKVMADAVLTSKCCFNSFCDRCIRDQIVGTSKCECGAPARADDLIPNPVIRTTIANMLAARAGSSGASGGTEKPRSSVLSNAAAAEPTPASSQESHRSHVTSEHSDGSCSSTSKIAATPAAPEPRTEQESATGSTTGPRPRASHAGADHHDGYDSVVPFGPARYDPFFGGTPWFAGPSMYYGGGYPMPGAPHHVDAMWNGGGSYGYHGSRKRTDREDWRHEERVFKRSCGGSRSQVAV